MPSYKLLARKRYALELFETGAISLLLNNLYSNKDCYAKYEVKRIGRLLEGEAFYHEIGQYYKCIGFEVEVECQFDFRPEPILNTGFYSTWVGKSHSCAPITFEEANLPFGTSYKFYNGCGDHIEVIKVLKEIEEVERVIKKLNISLAPSNNKEVDDSEQNKA